jgi:tyrosine-protein phosphatase YwqE
VAESAILARHQVKWGFRKAVCTSHRVRKYPNTPDDVKRACDLLREELSKQGIALELEPSMEYRLIPETWPETLEKGWLLPWEGNHILIELSIHNASKIGDIVPEDEIKKLLDMGYQPVLAHPERYLWATSDDYHRWYDAGVAFQRNLASLEGFYGPAPAARAHLLLDLGLYSFLGTDTHSRKYTDAFDAILK